MTDREKLIELIGGTRYGIKNCSTVGTNFQRGFIEKIANHLLANGVTFQKWIPVSERLPGENGDYLVFKGSSYGGWCEVAGFAKDGSEGDEYDLGGCENVWYDYDSEYGYIAFDSVTHWMPLPSTEGWK